MKLFKIFFVLLFSINSFAQQEKTIKVTYKLTLAQEEEVAPSPDANPEAVKFVKKLKKKMEETASSITGVLYCNSYSSTYMVDTGLSVGNKDELAFISSTLAGDGIFYVNIKDSIKFNQSNFTGKTFNIFYDINEYKWTTTNKTKKINGYTCYQATGVKTYYDYRKEGNVDVTPVVWYCPELPYKFGFNGLNGLNGLILEGSFNGKTFFYASNIDLDYKDESNILKKPTKGKDITEDEYNKLGAEIFNRTVNEN